jgi:hypothetical protein
MEGAARVRGTVLPQMIFVGCSKAMIFFIYLEEYLIQKDATERRCSIGSWKL